MTTARAQAMDILAELPEVYIVRVLDFMKKLNNAPVEKFTVHHKKTDAANIKKALNAISGALPQTDMTLEDFRNERLNKYANFA